MVKVLREEMDWDTAERVSYVLPGSSSRGKDREYVRESERGEPGQRPPWGVKQKSGEDA